MLGGDEPGLPNTLREIVLGSIAMLSAAGPAVVRRDLVRRRTASHRLLADCLDLKARPPARAIREAMAHGSFGSRKAATATISGTG